VRRERFGSFRGVWMFRRGIGREVEIGRIPFEVGNISCEISQSLAEFRKRGGGRGRRV